MGQVYSSKIEMHQLPLCLLLTELQLPYDIHGEVWIHGIPIRLLKLKKLPRPAYRSHIRSDIVLTFAIKT